MRLNFKTKLTIIMCIFSILLTLSVSLVDQNRLRANLLASYAKEADLVEYTILTAVSAADKAFQMAETEIEMKMSHFSNKLLQKYKDNPNVALWDYQALKNEMDGMDIYIIDDTQTVRHSSLALDVGLSFRNPDGTPTAFTQLLEKRLQGYRFISDGIDLETNSGKIRKYSYVPTSDHKYLIELGLYLERHPIFDNFNFLQISKNLVDKYDYVSDITVYTITGESLGKIGKDKKSIRVSSDKRDLFNKASIEGTVQIVKGELNGDPVTYRYVPYMFQFDQGITRFTDQRVIEIIYNEKELQTKLTQSKQVFILQLMATIAISLIISYLITRIVAKPMYLAFHDVLTGLSNRATFENSLILTMKKNQKKQRQTALLNIDLDNFKQVNDTFGHDVGDYFLKEVGKRIRLSVASSSDVTARLGGDEFVVILNHVEDAQAAIEVAKRIIHELERPLIIKGVNIVENCRTTASIGIALAPEHAQNSTELYKCADKALYQSKRSGKNKYSVYAESMEHVSAI